LVVSTKGLSVALIELSPETPLAPAAAAPPPAYFYRRIGLTLAALLVLALGGAAAPTSSVLWWRIGAMPLPTGGDFQVSGGRIYTMDLNADPRVLTAWQADPVRRLWSITGAGAEDPFIVWGSTADLVLVREGRDVTVRDSRTGAVRWASAFGLQQLTDTLGVVRKENFRPGTEYDPDSGDPGRLYGLNGSSLHTEPALSTELRGVELASGRRLWSFTVPGSVFTAFPETPGSGLVVLTSGRLILLSPDTGAVLRERPVSLLGGRGPARGEVVAGMVLVNYGDFGAGGRVIAYEPSTLAERWQRDQPDPAGNPANCYGLICSVSRDDLTVLDPRTGAPRWRETGFDLMPFGPGAALEVRNLSTPLRTVSLDTGRTLAELAGWTEYQHSFDGRALILWRPEQGRSNAFGLLPAGGTTVQPLGRLPGIIQQCQPAPGVVACQVGDHLEVWGYRG
jgi:outer membrane protein assembly factor BamB